MSKLYKPASIVDLISPRQESFKEKMIELWHARGLIRLLMFRDFRTRYAQTAIGFTWSLINPVLNILLLYFVFHKITNVETGNIPALLYTTTGMLPWTFFVNCVGQGGSALLANQSLIRKIYFPRLVLPLSKSLVALIEFLINGLILIGLFLYYGYPVTRLVLLFPVFCLLTFVTGVTAAVWISALTIRYRDFHFITPVLLRVGLFVTPIGYSYLSIPTNWQWFYFLNPLAGVAEGVKWTLLGTTFPGAAMVGGMILLLVLAFFSIYYFTRVEDSIADLL